MEYIMISTFCNLIHIRMDEHSDLPNLMNIRVDTAHGCTAAEDLRPVDVEGGNSLTMFVLINA
jgi:hypothetical protein